MSSLSLAKKDLDEIEKYEYKNRDDRDIKMIYVDV
jgi:hypothetical protein